MIVILWSVTSVTLTIAGVGLLCTRYLRQMLNFAGRGHRDTTRADEDAATRVIQLKKCTVLLVRAASMVRRQLVVQGEYVPTTGF